LANLTNVRDGKVWTYNTLKAFCVQFPYLSEKQIRTALDKQEKEGLTEVGNFNRMGKDRNKWYSVKDVNSHLPKSADGNSHLPLRAEHYQIVSQIINIPPYRCYVRSIVSHGGGSEEVKFQSRA